MDYTILLTCEYIFNETKCITYLTGININPVTYEYVYKLCYEWKVGNNKRKIRKFEQRDDEGDISTKLYNATTYDLTEYKNLLLVRYDDYFTGYENIIRYPDTLVYLILYHIVSNI
jgi:hypothetical protein